MDANSVFWKISPFSNREGDVNAIVETPQGSRNKFAFNLENGLFELDKPMPIGVTFPFEFGFVPGTLGGDGDPVDLLILIDAPTFVGCLVKARLLGVIDAEQKEVDGKVVRNDRLIGVAVESRRHRNIQSLHSLSEELLSEIEHFFISYNQVMGKQFFPLGRFGPQRAIERVREGISNVERLK